MSSFASITELSELYCLCMQRHQEDRPSVKDMLSLGNVQEHARRCGVYLGMRGKPKTLQELAGEKQVEREETLSRLETEMKFNQ